MTHNTLLEGDVSTDMMKAVYIYVTEECLPLLRVCMGELLT